MSTICEVSDVFSRLRDEIFHLRHQVYVGEQRWRQKYVDDEAQTIREPLDRNAHIYAAYVDGKLVGTVRSNYASESDLSEYFEMYCVDPDEFENAAVTSKLAVAKEFRASQWGFKLAAATYADGLKSGIRFSFVDCDRSMIPFYTRLGYKVYGPVTYRFPEVGEGVVMVLDAHDLENLRQTRSPFAKICQAWKEGTLA